MNAELTPRERKQYEQWLQLCRRIASGSEPPPDETPAARRARVARLLLPQNFPEFCAYYFAEYVTAPFGWFHRKAVADLFDPALRNHIWEWHRESAKSVFADIFTPCFLLCRGELDGMILASGNEAKAKKLLGDLQAHLASNKRLIHDFGSFGLSGSWVQGYYQTGGGIGFWAFGLGQNPAGVRNGHRRPNLGIVDDADDKDMARNQKRVREAVDWIRGEFMGCLQTKGRRFVYVNNRVHKHGLTAHLAGDLEEGDPKNAEFNHIKVYFTEDPETHAMKTLEQGGVPAWKENFTVDDCRRKIADMGYRNAMRQLYHLHIEQGGVFTDELLPWAEPLPLHRYDALVSYCDPAFGDSDKGCYRAVVLLGRTGRSYDVLWVWLRQNGNFARAQHDLHLGLAERTLFPDMEPVNVPFWTESNELQKILLKKIYEEENQGRTHPWWPRFDMDKKADKLGRIEGLEVLAEHGHLRFNARMKANKDMQALRDQFKGFPDGYVDGPDAVEGAIAKLKKKAAGAGFAVRTGSFIQTLTRKA